MLIPFTFNELLYVDDHLTPVIIAVQTTDRSILPSPPTGVSRTLILKIGTAIVAMEESYPQGGRDIEIELGEDELWALREMAISSVVVGQEFVGKNLKVKIYRALRDLSSHQITSSFLSAGESGNNRQSTLEKLRSLESKEDPEPEVVWDGK